MSKPTTQLTDRKVRKAYVRVFKAHQRLKQYLGDPLSTEISLAVPKEQLIPQIEAIVYHVNSVVLGQLLYRAQADPNIRTEVMSMMSQWNEAERQATRYLRGAND